MKNLYYITILFITFLSICSAQTINTLTKTEFLDIKINQTKLAIGIDKYTSQHSIMSQRFIKNIASAIETWNNSYLADKDYYDYISWSGGIISTQAFQNLSASFQQNVINANINEGNAGINGMRNGNAKGIKKS